MARRTLQDIEECILRHTVMLGAKKGLENISTLEIAKLCGISEPTIFVHFKTKKNLIIQAGRRLDSAIRNIIAGIHFDIFDIQDTENLTNKIKQTWRACFDYLYEHPDDTRYYNRYRHSAYYTETPDYAEGGIYAHAVNFMLLHNCRLKEYSDIGYPAVAICTIDSTLNFVETMIDGKLRYEEKILDLIFKLIFGILI